MSYLKRVVRVSSVALVAGCTSDASTPTGPEFHANLTISDAAHGGAVSGFYFLPPMVPQPSFSGTFDPGLAPVVEVCVLAGTTCGGVVATFSGPSVRTETDHYIANWSTRSLATDPHYRITVRVGEFVLGFADVDLVARGRERSAASGQYVVVVEGQTLPIRFRVETGIAADVEVTPAEATVEPGGTQQFAATVRDLHGDTIPGAPVAWASADHAVATIDGAGLATATAPGTTTITASSGAASGTASLTVRVLNTAPLAAADTFQAIGNLTVPVSAPGVLGNDSDPEGDPLTVVAATVPTAGGGTATLAADGSFTYRSAAGFTGTDSFEYTLSDGALTATGTVTLQVPTRVWYARNDAAAPGDGRDASPFARLKDAEAASAAGETVFLMYGDGTTAGYDEGFAFKPGQALTGQGVASDISALLNGEMVLLLAAGGTPTLTRAGPGATVQIATANVLQGVDVESTAGAGIAGSAFGTFAAGRVQVAAVGGPALDLQNGTLVGEFATLSSDGSTGHGLSLTQVTGTLAAPAGSIADAAAVGVRIAGGGATVDFGGDVSGSGARAVEVTGRAAGVVTLAGLIQDASGGIRVADNTGGTVRFTGPAKALATGSAAAVTLADNGGATVIFAGGGLQIQTTTGAGFTAVGGGLVSVTGAGNTVASTGGVAVRVSGATIGTAGLTFRSVSAAGGANGIVLENTGTLNGFQVTGDGTPGSGGTLSGMAGADGSSAGIGVYLAATRNVVLRHMHLHDFDNFAVRGVDVSGFTLDGTTVDGSNGSSPALNEGSLVFDGLTGSASLTESSISGGAGDNLRVVNQAGILDRLTLDDVVVGPNGAAGDDGVELVAQGSAVLRATITGSRFTSARANLLRVTLLGSATGDLVLTGNEFRNAHPGVLSGGGGVLVGGSEAAQLTYLVSGNTFRDARGSALAIGQSGGTPGFSGTIANNTIGVPALDGSGSAQGSGLALASVGGGTHTVAVTGNQVRQYNNHGILLQVGNAGLGGPGVLNATVTGNVVGEPGSVAFIKNGIHLNAGTTGGDAHLVCLAMSGNSLAGSGSGEATGTDVRLRQRFLTTVRLPGYAGGNADDAAVQAFVQATNGSTPTVLAQNTVAGGGGGYTGGAACPTP